MMRILGEQSACRAMGKRMGGPDASTVWDSLDAGWCARVIAHTIADVPLEQQDTVSLILSNVVDASLDFIFLRTLAHELYLQREQLHVCWAWDAWVCREPYSQLAVVAVALKTIVERCVTERRASGWTQSECPIGFETMSETGLVTKWRSLHPCECRFPQLSPRCRHRP
jgi:hypothetical protein